MQRLPANAHVLMRTTYLPLPKYIRIYMTVKTSINQSDRQFNY